MRSCLEHDARRRALRILGMTVAALATWGAFLPDARGADPWVNRRQTLGPLNARAEVGGGVASHPSDASAGVNAEAGVGLPILGEVGVRSGYRGAGSGAFARADYFGRLFDTETFGTGYGAFANPEIMIRNNLVGLHVFELGLELRGYVPAERGTHVGGMFGVPICVHVLDKLRIDTGVFGALFYGGYVRTGDGKVETSSGDGASAVASVPLRMWVQTSKRTWFGVLTGARYRIRGSAANPQLSPVAMRPEGPTGPSAGVSLDGKDPGRLDVLAGLGFGLSLTSFLDLKAQVLTTRVNGPGFHENIGAGLGVGARLE